MWFNGRIGGKCIESKGKSYRCGTTIFFIDAGFDYPKITQLIVTQDMSERKNKND